MDVWTTIKVLHNRGVSIRQIAKQLRISGNTVRKYLSTEDHLDMKRPINMDQRVNGRSGEKR